MQKTECKGHSEQTEDCSVKLNFKAGLSVASGGSRKSIDDTESATPDTSSKEYLDSDEIIAKLLQEEFNAELETESGGSKNQVSRYQDGEQLDEDDLDDYTGYESDSYDEPIVFDWACTDTKRKKLPTNYESILFLPRHRKVDAVEKELSKLSFEKSRKLQNRADTAASVTVRPDETTPLELDELVNARILRRINGTIALGSGAHIIHADGNLERKYEMKMSRECVIKVFQKGRELEIYNNMRDDYRFKKRIPRQGGKKLLNMWAEKEMLNMDRLHKARLPCADIIHLKDNILVMSFIGEGQIPAPKLKFAQISKDMLKVAYMQIIQNMRTMYRNAGIVHADLSEHNILWFNGKCWYIDLAQSVHTSHPSALEFLMNDCTNILSYFERCGLKDMKTKVELFQYITSMNPNVLKQ